jgi:CO/xanthine dehydrogenase FAD-binding subunit
MRAYVPDYELRSPATLTEALALLDSEPGVWKPFAGGTDLMVLLEAGSLEHTRFLSLWHLPELKGIEATPRHVILGGLTTYTEVLQSPILRQEFPLLCRAAQQTGGVATQNRGTLAGNIVNASPAADSAPALLVYDAELDLVSARRARWVPYHGFHTGYKEMQLAPNEIIRRIRLPRLARPRFHYYRKVGTRKAQAISKVCFAGVAEVEGSVLREVRIALGSVAPIPLRCTRTEAALRGKEMAPAALKESQQALAGEISPIDDMRSTARYRRWVALNLLADFLQQAPSVKSS